MISLGIKPPNPYETPGYNYNLNDKPASQYYEKKNIEQQNQEYHNSSKINQQVNQQVNQLVNYINHPVNKYSPQYASYMGIKPKATTSAKLNMNTLMRNNMRKR
jgi:hypothetical protein